MVTGVLSKIRDIGIALCSETPLKTAELTKEPVSGYHRADVNSETSFRRAIGLLDRSHRKLTKPSKKPLATKAIVAGRAYKKSRNVDCFFLCGVIDRFVTYVIGID
jgi:hypothetical protein